jgi:uncharacterized DUF497 family protein
MKIIQTMKRVSFASALGERTCVYVVYTMNGERYRIIHARKADKQADKQMEKLYEAG